MNKYEILYIIQNDIEDDQKTAIVNKFSSLVESLGGTVDSLEQWGTKKFAYTIANTQTEGFYVLMNISAKDNETAAEIDRNMRNDEKVVRCMIIRK
ncbi:MAG TPA: 30S ribosomal protein S6 [Clostridia bacterium]|nr:30S ribosomal protein S6 [Clostridia bacterium]